MGAVGCGVAGRAGGEYVVCGLRPASRFLRGDCSSISNQSGVAAQADGAPRLHPTGNLLARPAVRKGDLARGLAEAAVVVEGTWQTQWIEHAYIEAEAGVGETTRDGTTVLTVSTQTPYMDRDATAKVLGIAPGGIRVVQAVTGGGFGGKLDLSVQPYLALAVKSKNLRFESSERKVPCD